MVTVPGVVFHINADGTRDVDVYDNNRVILLRLDNNIIPPDMRFGGTSIWLVIDNDGVSFEYRNVT